MRTLMDLLARLRAYVTALSPRERAGVTLVAALASAALAAGVVDWSMTARDTAQDAAVQAARAEAAYARESNRGYQEGVRLAARAVEDWSVVEASDGVAQARTAAALRTLANDAGLSNLVITAPAPEASGRPAGAIAPLALTLSADFEWASFTALLREMRRSSLVFEAESIEVNSRDEGAQTFTMTVRTPFLRREPQS